MEALVQGRCYTNSQLISIAMCIVLEYTLCRQGAIMIKSFRHKGIQRFFERGTTAGIQAMHADKLARQLRHLSDAATPHDMNIPGWRLHLL